MDNSRPDDEIARLFDGIKAFEPDAAVVDWPARSRAQWKAKMQAEDEARYGTVPRNTWPKAGRLYTQADKDERDYWIRKLYGEQGLAVLAVSDLIGISGSAISNRVRAMGIGRSGKMGVGHTKQRVANQRRRLVRQLHENGASVREIAAELGWHETTIASDIHQMGLPLRPPPRPSGLTADESRELIDNAVRQLAGVARLVQGAKLSDPKADIDTLREWDRSLSAVVVAVRKIRKAMKGNDDE